MKKPYKPETIDLPPLMRFILWAGRPMGVAYVPLHHVQVIYRMGKYAGCKGPGLIYYNKLTETLGPLVSVEAQVEDFKLDTIVSRDVVPVTVTIAAVISYDPAASEPELASIMTRLPKETYVSVAGTFVRWALLSIANRFNASELTQHTVRAQVEEAVRDTANEELAYLGLKLAGKLRITRAGSSTRLADRHETIAQRRANILAGTEFHPLEYRRALVSEVIETLGRRGESEAFMNFNEMLESVAEENRPALPAPPNLVELPPENAEGSAAPPAGSSATSPAPPPEPPPARRTEPRSGPRRPKSRL